MIPSSRWYLAAGLLLVTLQQPASLPSFATPGISPDGSEIAFVNGGDIWSVPTAGGEARLLVSHPAIESRPLYSPDGAELAFTSTRAGSVDVWVLTLATGALRRLTFEDGAEQLDGWSPDGQWLYYSSSSRDISGMNDVYRVRAGGGTPVPVSADRYASEYWAAPAPDGKTVAITARGTSSGQWWRKGSSHLDQSQILLVHPGAVPTYQPETDGAAREGWPMWSADGSALWYVSDRGGNQNIWTRPLQGSARPVTQFHDGRVLWPSITRDGKRIAFERDFDIWTLETTTGRAARVPITLRGAGSQPAAERITYASQFQEMALSPDGKKIALTVRGEIFAVSAKDGGAATRVTRSPALEEQESWSPDSRKLVYVSERSGALNLFSYDFTTATETRLTDQPLHDVTPKYSPDGKQVAFVRDGRELRVLDLETRKERLLATGVMDREPFTSPRSFAWSPDGKWIAFLTGDSRGFTNAFLVRSAGGDARQVSFLANAFAGSISWSPSGAYLLINSGQRTEPGALARVDLVPRTPRFREDQFRDLFNQESPQPNRVAPPPAAVAPPAPKDSAPPVTPAYEFSDVRRRLSLLPVEVDVGDQVISPDGKSVVMIAGAAGRTNLYLWPLDELSNDERVARQLTATSGGKRDMAFSPDGKEIFYLEAGRVGAYNLESRQTRSIAVTAEMDVDFEREKMEVFRQGWMLQRDNFADPGFHGTDWNAVRAIYEPRIAGARSPDEMRRIMGLMVGELNSSHSGINAPPGPAAPATGRLGVRFDPAELERGAFKVAEVIPLGPSAIAGIHIGDWLLAVDGERLGPLVNVDALLMAKVGRRVVLLVGGEPRAAGREVVVRPVSSADEKSLLYRAWVEDRRAYVARISNGRLGYVHLFDMGAPSLAQLAVDLDTENQGREGVVIDIRNNNGGFVNAYALDIFGRRPYLSMQPRGGPVMPARSQLGQRALERPTVLVTNQHSLSDAEDFSEGYRSMGLGKVVGEPTAGWIIYTSNLSLLDGTVMRMPFIRITGTDGKDMELVPRPVDVLVERPIGESYSGRDTQLDAAVRTLLAQLGKQE